jgi:ubiquinone biosynthesis protein
MREQIGPQALRDRLAREASQWAQTLPQIPRLAYSALARVARDQAGGMPPWAEALIAETRRTRRWLAMLAVSMAIIAAAGGALVTAVLLR